MTKGSNNRFRRINNLECLFTIFGGLHASYSESLPVSDCCSNSGTRFEILFVRIGCFLLRRCLLLNSTVYDLGCLRVSNTVAGFHSLVFEFSKGGGGNSNRVKVCRSVVTLSHVSCHKRTSAS